MKNLKVCLKKKDLRSPKERWISNWMIQEKLIRQMSPEERRRFRSQRIKCFFGMHIFRKYDLMYGDARDGVYLYCVFCHKVGKRISLQAKLTAGMSQG